MTGWSVPPERVQGVVQPAAAAEVVVPVVVVVGRPKKRKSLALVRARYSVCYSRTWVAVELALTVAFDAAAGRRIAAEARPSEVAAYPGTAGVLAAVEKTRDAAGVPAVAAEAVAAAVGEAVDQTEEGVVGQTEEGAGQAAGR
jgi:predicted Ser/Thr protein kinase